MRASSANRSVSKRSSIAPTMASPMTARSTRNRWRPRTPPRAGMAASLGAPGAPEHLPDGHAQDGEIAARRAAREVLRIELEFRWQHHRTVGAVEILVRGPIASVAAGDLVGGIGEDRLFVAIGQGGRSCDPWQGTEDSRMQRIRLVDVSRVLWPRTDQRHVAADDVPELRELVKLRSSQCAAETRHPSIARRRDAGARAAGADPHRPELVEGERTARSHAC